MEKLFKSKVAFIAFVIIFTSFLLFIYKDLALRISIAILAGGYTGWNIAQWYWKDKMDKIKDQLDARMASPEQIKIIKIKDDQLTVISNANMELVKKNAELQKENTELKKMEETFTKEVNTLMETNNELRSEIQKREFLNDPTIIKGV